MIFLSIIGVVLTICILIFPVVGLSSMLILPLLKDLANIQADPNSMSNLTFILILITAFSFLLHNFNQFKSLKLNDKQIVFFLIFIAILSFSYLYTKAPEYGFEKLLKFVLINGFIFIASYILFQETNNIRIFKYSFKYIILIIAIINTGLLLKYILSGGLIKMFVARFTITGGNPIGMARTMGLGFIIWFFEIERKERIHHKIIALLCILPISISLIATNTRGPILMLLIIVFVYILYYWGKRNQDKLLIFISLFLVVIVILLILPSNFFNRYSSFFEQGVLSTSKSVSQSSSSAMRLIYFSRIIKYFIEKPMDLLFGTGIGNFLTLFSTVFIVRYPHNVFFEILFEIGLIGLSIFLVSLITLQVDLNRIRRKNPYSYKKDYLLFVFSFYYLLLNAQVSGDIFDNRFLWLFWGGIIALMNLKPEFKVNRRDSEDKANLLAC